MRLQVSRPAWRFLMWWLGIAVVGSIVAWSLVGVAYPRIVYFFVLMPIGGVLLFPMAYAANRWLTPVLGAWFRRS